MGAVGMRWKLVVLSAAATLAGACGPGDGGGTRPGSPTSAPTTSGGVELSRSCTRTDGGTTVRVRYPGGWQTNGSEVIPACSVFDPDPVVIPVGSELPLELDISIQVERVPLERLRQSPAATVEDTKSAMVAGRPALRQEQVSTGEGLLDRGVRSVRYLVDLGPSTLIATTYKVQGNDFERSVRVLDAMAGALEIGGIEP